jgi:hypothetical protein
VSYQLRLHRGLSVVLARDGRLVSGFKGFRCVIGPGLLATALAGVTGRTGISRTEEQFARLGAAIPLDSGFVGWLGKGLRLVIPIRSWS